MEKYVTLLIPALLTLILFRILLSPMRMAWRVLLHSAGGLVCLGILNTVSGFTGIVFPVNAVTVLVAGFGGLPGMGVLALLEIL